MKLAIYGGTFDPPHLAHLSIIEEAAKHVERLLVMPAFQSPHKEIIATNTHDRIAMLQLLIKSNTNVELSHIELERQARSFTYITLKEVALKYPKYHIAIVLGADQYNALSTWTKFEEWKAKVEFMVFPRTNFNLKLRDDINTSVLKGDFESISSTTIRERVANKLSVEKLTGLSISKYIKSKGLYQ